MKKILLGVALCSLLACHKESPEVILNQNYYYQHDLSTVYDGTVVVQDANLSGQGSQQVNAESVAIFSGTVLMDGLGVIGEAYIPEGSTVIIDGPLVIAGGAKLTVDGDLQAESIAQTGDAYISSSQVVVEDKYQISGGSTLYLENAHIQVDQFVLIGDVEALLNDSTITKNYYSVIEGIGVKFLSRAGGTNVCGPVLFTESTVDNNTSSYNLSDVTSTALTQQPKLYSIYGLDSVNVYQFEDQFSCTPLTEIP